MTSGVWPVLPRPPCCLRCPGPPEATLYWCKCIRKPSHQTWPWSAPCGKGRRGAPARPAAQPGHSLKRPLTGQRRELERLHLRESPSSHHDHLVKVAQPHVLQQTRSGFCTETLAPPVLKIALGRDRRRAGTRKIPKADKWPGCGFAVSTPDKVL